MFKSLPWWWLRLEASLELPPPAPFRLPLALCAECRGVPCG